MTDVPAIALVGMSHRTAPIETREQLALDDEATRQVVSDLVGLAGIDEAVVLSTCNRVEVVVAGTDEQVLVDRVRRYLIERSGLSERSLRDHSYSLVERDAVQHMFRVTSSLDSLVVGEPQILGQVKSAYRTCSEIGGTAHTLNRAFSSALNTAKRVRTDTKIAENAVSISYAAVELAKKVFGQLAGLRAMVIGAGKMGGLALKHFQAAGARELHIVNRSVERARRAAAAHGGIPHGLDELESMLEKVDIVVTSTGSQNYIVTYDVMKRVVAKRRYKPLFLIDIAVPRDIDPRCDGLSNVYLFDVDDLEKVVAANLEARRGEAARAERIVAEATDEMMRWIAQHKVVPTIVQLREKLCTLRDSELDRFLRAHPELDDKTRADVERLVNGLVNKVLHEPTVSLRNSVDDVDGSLVTAVRSLFRLGETTTQAEGE